MKKELLHRFFDGTSTYDEEQKIKSWLEASPENNQLFMKERLLYDVVILHSDEYETAEHTDNQLRNPLMLSLKQVSAIAAVMLLLIVSGLYLFDAYQKSAVSFNTILVPPGQRINVILSDNSNVWLNANTTFKYPTRFDKKNRTVYLDGEGHFEVESDKKSPFVVETSYGTVQATGTTFNVEAYSKYDLFIASLFEGEVDVEIGNKQCITLLPNQCTLLSDGQLLIAQITDRDKFLWKNGLIAFNDSKLEEILNALDKYFDVKIQIDMKQLPNRTYTGKFRQSDGIDYALRVLQRSIQFEYIRDDNSGIIYIK